MKRYARLFLALVSFVIFLSVSSFSQEVTELKTDGSDDMNENFNQAEKPDDSYLAKFHAQVVVDRLIKKNLEQIYMLNVIVTNFSKYNWKGDYDNIYAEYKRAMELYYKRNIIFARVWLERNKKSISDLMKKMAEQYDKDTQLILNECHKQIISLHLDQKTRSDPNKLRQLIDNQMRLQIAYGQMDDAEREYTAKNYESSLYHYRLAKGYAIRILEAVAYDEGGKTRHDGTEVPDIKTVKETYKIDKADNRNRIFQDAQQKSTNQ
jgi:hypothetical protein